MKIDYEQCLLLKQRYPIGRKFWAKVRRIRPFGIFVEIDETPKDSDRCVESVGLIDMLIVRTPGTCCGRPRIAKYHSY